MGKMTAEQAAEAAKGLTFEKVWAAFMESRERMEQSEERMERSQDEFQKKMDKIISDLSKQVGKISNSIGEMTEAMFSGVLWDKFGEHGIEVTEQSARKKFTMDGKVIAEADIYIENGSYAIPVEIKTRLTEADVNKYMARMETLRNYLDRKNDKRKLLGAMAGGVITNEALKYAQGNGLFVLVQSGESVTIAETPVGFTAREW